MSEKKLFLLDAYALIFRAYYALMRNPRITSKGKNTNAQFGFTNTLIELINKQKPTHIAVCFDVGGSVAREADFADYKANRQETPEDLLAAVPDIKKIIEGFNIPVIGVEGFEADDVIGTLAWEAHDAGYDVFMVTPDKDYGQLVREGISIYKPAYQGNDVEIMGPKEVCEKWDIERVNQVIDILGLMGDAVDNIPGIKGVGEKTAAKLLKEYDTLENVLANAENIKGALGEKVRAGKDDAVLSKKLATIITNVPVEFHEENFKLKDWNKEALKEVFTELEFKTLGKRILGEEINITNANVQTDLFGNVVSTTTAKKTAKPSTPVVAKELQLSENAETINEEKIVVSAAKNINNTPHTYHLVQTENEIKNLVTQLQSQQEICFDTETTGLDANQTELVGMSFAFNAHEAYYVPCSANQTETKNILAQFQTIFNDEKIIWIGQNIKYDLLVLKWYGVELKGNIYDTMLAHYVVEPEGKRSMDLLSAQYLQYEPVHIEELIGKKGKTQGTMRDVEIEKIKDYAAEDADITLQLKYVLHPLLKEREVEKVFYEVENPLVKVLTNMEFEGVKIDEHFLREYSKELERDAKAAEERVYKQAEVRFNLASPKQLGDVLFEKLKLDSSAKKTKTGQYQTGEDVLLKLATRGHSIADDILIFRELSKLKSTYVDALPEMINPKTGRVHTTYGQAVAVTGRLASNNPNLQNIPIRTDKGREIRKAFVPRSEERILLSADYSQIELRIVAAISGDENMCHAFREGKDIHTATAAKVYNVDEKDVTKEMRYKAKSVNFGIIYGQGAFGLADNLGISRTEAKEIIDSYKKEFSGIQKYMDDTIAFARQHGFVQTIIGRKRWLRDINSSNYTVRGFAERNAINSPIQGSAADMIKLAMIKIHAAIKKENLQSKMILQVHDELVFDVVENEIDILKPLILENMRTALLLPNNVPVEAEVGIGKNWLEAH
ncbi:MAG: DNA polymerase I [Chitinophagaceae bacterium]|nr:DNA polymerase I [Chitinophagaceae bacterium]MCW5904332.1 DNA polymerase I [Chitinophagaceae bacterium]